MAFERFEYTLLSLADYGKIMGITPPHLWQGASATIFADNCKGVWYAHDWQSGKQISRESLAYAILQAESDIADVLGYWPAPKWISKEITNYPQYYRRDMFGNGKTTRGLYKSVEAGWGKFISPGRRAVTLIADSTTVTYSDEDSDGYSETATITVNNVTVSDVCELKVYFEDKSGLQEWEIRPPKSKTLSGGILTVVFDAWLLLDPDLQEAYPNTNDPLEPIDILTASNYVSTVDVYREYTDTTVASAEFSWLPDPSNGILCPVCGSSGTCVACANTTQDGCISVLDVVTGMVVPQPATYDSDNAQWNGVCWSECREPDTVKIWYYAGELDEYYLRGTRCDPLKNSFKQAIAWLATARLDRNVCGCSNVIDLFEDLRRDLALSEPEGGSYFVSDDNINNPFGTRKGEIMAWNKIKNLTEQVPDLAMIGQLMKLVKWTDHDGYKHLSWLKDNEPETNAKNGLSHDPPDVNRIDWEQVKRELHNAMVDKELQSWDDIQKHQTALTSITASVIKKYLVFLFREGEIK